MSKEYPEVSDKLQEKLRLSHKTIETLKEEVRLLQNITSLSNEIFLITNQVGEILLTAGALTKLLGYSQNDLLNKKISGYVHPDDSIAFDDYLAKLTRSGKPLGMIFRFRNSNHRYLWFESTGRIVGKEVKQDNILLIFTDISERISLKTDLQQSENRFKKLVENLPFVIFRYSKNLKHIYASPNVSGLLPFEADELIGTGYDELGFDEEKVRFFEISVQQVIDSGEPVHKEFSQQTQKGLLFLEWELFPEFDNHQRVTSVLGIIKDVTEEILSKRELLKSREILAASERLLSSGSFTCNLKNGEIFWSEGMHFLMNRKMTELTLGMDDLKDYLSETDFHFLKDEMNHVSATRKSSKFDLTFIVDLGITKTFLVELHPDPSFNENNPKILGIVKDETVLRNITESLSQTEEKFKLIFETIPDAVSLTRLTDGLFIDVNEGFLNLTGYRYKEVINQTSVEIGLFKNLRAREEFVAGVRKGPVINQDLVFFDKKGRAVEVLISAAPIIIGNEDLLISIFRDVSEIKRKERLLKLNNLKIRESEDKFAAFFDHSPDGIAIADESGIIQEWNLSLELFTGIKARDAIGKDVYFIQEHIEKYNIGKKEKKDIQKARIISFFESAQNEFLTRKFEIDLLIPHVGRKQLENIIFSIKTQRGSRIGLISRDVTEEKKASENALLYKYIFDYYEDGVAILDTNGYYLETNNAHEKITGFKAKECKLKNPSLFFGEKLFAEIFKVYDYQGAFEGEHTAKSKDGNEVIVDFLMFPVFFEDKPICIVAIIRDITNRKKAQQELLQAKRRAEEADRLKTAFLSNMSHEIRTPMNSIIGFSNLLKNPKISDNQREKYIKYINKNGENLLNLVGDIIDIAKIESNELRINKKQCDLRELLEEVNESMFKVLELEKKEEKVRLILKETNHNKVSIFTDCFRLRQILVNLIHNAIKFTSEGFIEFGYIQAQPEELLFHVKDTGMGIPEELKSSVFERFRKLENSRQKLYGGAGLGLAISRQLVNLLGGKIWLESYQGKGTTFYFTLPFITAHNIPRTDQTPAEEIETMDWSERKVLIVEDDIYSFELTSEYLFKTGIEIIKAENGIHALNILKSDPDIELVIMDIQLPELSGFELIKKLRELNIKIPVIAQTAYAMDEDRKLALSSGCNDFLAKPVDKSSLLKMVHKHLNLIPE